LKTIHFYKEHPHYLNDDIKNKIPFLNLNEHHKNMLNEIDNAMKKVIHKSNFVLGEELQKFEEEFAKYCGKKYGVGVGNGTDALKISLTALNIKKGDEVIVPVNTAIPTAMAIKDIGAEVCFVDCNENYLIDTNKIEEKINEKTRAIIPVHLYGKVCNMDKIEEISRKYNLKIIEDCCQAHGSLYKGKKTPITSIGCFSFYPSKNLGCFGDGGMIVSDDEELIKKIKLLRNYGQSSRYSADIIGINSRLDEIQASILRIKLKYLQEFNNKRKNIAKLYNQLLDKKNITTPCYSEDDNYHLYVIRTKNRDKILEHLKAKNIESLIHYPIPLYMQKAFSYLMHKKEDFPNAYKFSNEILSLPIYPELKEEEIVRICKEVNSVNKTNNLS
jgi:dTDP-4-amino-4,6-dideoxygalactose transaminase